MTFAHRVKEARELRGLTQAQLAERLDVSIDRSAIAHIEAGNNMAKPEVLEAIARATDLPESFFEDPDDTDFPEGTLLFRALSDMTARQEAQAREWGKLIFRRVLWLSRNLRVPPVTIPRLTNIEPEEAALHARASLGLSPDRPIAHVLNAFERGGVIVIAAPVVLEKRDAFAAWAGDPLRPVMVLLAGAPGDRQRFSAAHEFGHLVLHTTYPSRIPVIEAEASRFAAEFLMPTRGIFADLTPPITLAKLVPLKQKWGVAIQTLVRRAKTLGVINNNQYNYLFQQIGRRGWKVREPEAMDIPVEKPRAFRKMAEVLYGEPLDYRRMARDLRLHPHLVRQIVEGYATREELPRRGHVGEPSILEFPRPTLIRE
jgi:Zn-dependent peptidase ImmA (M78 family)/transcriptional regulator with XRE-family HTH domain